MQTNGDFLTISEAAQLLKVSKTSLRRWSNEGRLRCYRVGHRGERRFRHDELLAFVYGPEKLIETYSDAGRIAADPSGEKPQLRAPCHLCTMFKGKEDQWRQIRSHVLRHLVPGAQTVYAFHPERSVLLDRLRAEGLDGETLIEQGRLHLVSSFDCYLAGGRFDPDRMLDLVVELIHRGTQSGIQNLLLTGEMGWCASKLHDSAQLMRYEAALDGLLRSYPWVTVICQYSLTDLPATIIFDNLCLHPYVQMPDRLVVGLKSGVAV
ncbi:MAG: MEDS domain-containing protein [Gammaproteobacteria bacterium]